MHSFHHSRGRIVFEALCALTIGAAGTVAWLQTGASAMLAMAGVATLYGLVHATDAIRRSPPSPVAAAVAEPKAQAQAAHITSAEGEPVADEAPKAPKARPGRKKKAAAKVVAEPAVAEFEVVAAVFDEPPAAECEEAHHAIVTPLFEPQPLVRQQRTVFGRKAG